MIRQYGRRAWLTILMAIMPLACLAQAAPETLQLETITILGTRTKKAPDKVPRSIDVIERDQIARQQSTDLGAVVDMLPNVSLAGSPRPFGETISIRGLSGDRILLLVDGIELNNSIGHIGGSFISPGLIESVEVERGPASVLWGSGALGGVVSVDTKDAADLLADGQAIGARLHTGYQSATDGWIIRGAVYGRLGDNIDALVQLGRASHENLELGNGETLGNSAYRRVSGLAKATWHIAPGHSLRFSHRRMQLESVSPLNPTSSANTTSNELADREIEVGASRIEWQFLPPSSELVDLTVAFSHIRTETNTRELQGPERSNGVVVQYGLDVANTSRLDLGGFGRHVLTYGFDVDRGSVETGETGGTSPSSVDATQLVAGLFVQDEIHWNEAWTTTFGLRYDYYQSESADVARDQEDSALSLQAGLLWQATDWLQLYASYAEAFRAPSLTEMYTTGLHFGANRFVPNPELKPEKAANKEVGLRAEWEGLFAPGDRLEFEVTAFHNDVENYIQQKVETVLLPGPPNPPFIGGTTTVDNVHDAELEGFEAVASYATDTWFMGVTYGQTRGYNETKDQPLAGIPADTWVVKAGLTNLPWNGRIVWRMTHAEAQHRVPPDGQPTDSYTVHDLITSWHPAENLRLNFAISNITDRAYRRHNSVIPEAGRNFKLGVTYKF